MGISNTLDSVIVHIGTVVTISLLLGVMYCCTNSENSSRYRTSFSNGFRCLTDKIYIR